MVRSDLFSKAELSRYNRHVIIPEFGLDAQEKLKKSSVLVIGAGGLGSPLLLYLAAAGIGNIGIVDCDVVDESNLQRQVLFGTDAIGVSKTEAARQRLESLNPYVNIRVYNTQLTSKNALKIIKDYDLVADGTDNFPTRYLVNDACVMLNRPNVHASIYQFEGQVSVFNLEVDGIRGPNYRDLYPSPPEPGLVANCSEAGVLGVLPGIIGSMQALEVIKIVAQIGEPLNGKLFVFDALSFESRILKIKKNSANPLNGDHPTIRTLLDYESFCGVNAIEKKIKQVDPTELLNWQQQGQDIQLIDVREPQEYELANINAELIPASMLAEQTDRIDRHKKVVVMCKTGVRSDRAIRLLEEKFGYHNLYNLKGGLINYVNELELDLPRF